MVAFWSIHTYGEIPVEIILKFLSFFRCVQTLFGVKKGVEESVFTFSKISLLVNDSCLYLHCTFVQPPSGKKAATNNC